MESTNLSKGYKLHDSWKSSDILKGPFTVLGTGNYSVVIKATFVKSATAVIPVALKIFKPSADVDALFYKEVLATALVKSDGPETDHFPLLIGHGRFDGDMPYEMQQFFNANIDDEDFAPFFDDNGVLIGNINVMVQTLLKGQELAEELIGYGQNHVNPKHIRLIMFQLCWASYVVQAKFGMVHNDIKTENIRIVPSNRNRIVRFCIPTATRHRVDYFELEFPAGAPIIKYMDFGAVHLDTGIDNFNHLKPAEASPMHTPIYAAPELIDTAGADTRTAESDVWSLGMVALTLACQARLEFQVNDDDTDAYYYYYYSEVRDPPVFIGAMQEENTLAFNHDNVNAMGDDARMRQILLLQALGNDIPGDELAAYQGDNNFERASNPNVFQNIQTAIRDGMSIGGDENSGEHGLLFVRDMLDWDRNKRLEFGIPGSKHSLLNALFHPFFTVDTRFYKGKMDNFQVEDGDTFLLEFTQRPPLAHQTAQQQQAFQNVFDTILQRVSVESRDFVATNDTLRAAQEAEQLAAEEARQREEEQRRAEEERVRAEEVARMAAEETARQEAEAEVARQEELAAREAAQRAAEEAAEREAIADAEEQATTEANARLEAAGALLGQQEDGIAVPRQAQNIAEQVKIIFDYISNGTNEDNFTITRDALLPITTAMGTVALNVTQEEVNDMVANIRGYDETAFGINANGGAGSNPIITQGFKSGSKRVGNNPKANGGAGTNGNYMDPETILQALSQMLVAYHVILKRKMSVKAGEDIDQRNVAMTSVAPGAAGVRDISEAENNIVTPALVQEYIVYNQPVVDYANQLLQQEQDAIEAAEQEAAQLQREAEEQEAREAEEERIRNEAEEAARVAEEQARLAREQAEQEEREAQQARQEQAQLEEEAEQARQREAEAERSAAQAVLAEQTAQVAESEAAEADDAPVEVVGGLDADTRDALNGCAETLRTRATNTSELPNASVAKADIARCYNTIRNALSNNTGLVQQYFTNQLVLGTIPVFSDNAEIASNTNAISNKNKRRQLAFALLWLHRATLAVFGNTPNDFDYRNTHDQMTRIMRLDLENVDFDQELQEFDGQADVAQIPDSAVVTYEQTGGGGIDFSRDGMMTAPVLPPGPTGGPENDNNAPAPPVVSDATVQALVNLAYNGVSPTQDVQLSNLINNLHAILANTENSEDMNVIDNVLSPSDQLYEDNLDIEFDDNAELRRYALVALWYVSALRGDSTFEAAGNGARAVVAQANSADDIAVTEIDNIPGNFPQPQSESQMGGLVSTDTADRVQNIQTWMTNIINALFLEVPLAEVKRGLVFRNDVLPNMEGFARLVIDPEQMPQDVYNRLIEYFPTPGTSARITKGWTKKTVANGRQIPVCSFEFQPNENSDIEVFTIDPRSNEIENGNGYYESIPLFVQNAPNFFVLDSSASIIALLFLMKAAIAAYNNEGSPTYQFTNNGPQKNTKESIAYIFSTLKRTIDNSNTNRLKQAAVKIQNILLVLLPENVNIEFEPIESFIASENLATLLQAYEKDGLDSEEMLPALQQHIQTNWNTIQKNENLTQYASLLRLHPGVKKFELEESSKCPKDSTFIGDTKDAKKLYFQSVGLFLKCVESPHVGNRNEFLQKFSQFQKESYKKYKGVQHV